MDQLDRSGARTVPPNARVNHRSELPQSAGSVTRFRRTEAPGIPPIPDDAERLRSPGPASGGYFASDSGTHRAVLHARSAFSSGVLSGAPDGAWSDDLRRESHADTADRFA